MRGFSFCLTGILIVNKTIFRYDDSEVMTMKKITMFYLDDCGYCHKAHKALDELMEENPAYKAIEIKKVEESQEPEYADQFDYYATPTFYVGDQKIFEAHIGMTYEQIKAEVKHVLDTALA